MSKGSAGDHPQRMADQRDCEDIRLRSARRDVQSQLAALCQRDIKPEEKSPASSNMIFSSWGWPSTILKTAAFRRRVTQTVGRFQLSVPSRGQDGATKNQQKLDPIKLEDRPRCRVTRIWISDPKMIKYFGDDGRYYGCYRTSDGLEEWFYLADVGSNPNGSV